MAYLRRHIDGRLARLMAVHPACLVEGIRGVGKTSSAQRLAASTLRLDDPPVAAMVAEDPQAAFGALVPPVLIDEWQRVPTVWDAVRRCIDDDRVPGGFILSGSSRAALAADVHAGAGRILPARLRPMTLCERRGEAPAVSLADLAAHGIDAVRGVRSPLTPPEQTDAITESGLPGYLGMDPVDHHEALRAYLDLAVARDLAEIASAQRDVTKLRSYIRAYGATIATTAEHAAVHNAAGVSKATGESYHDLLTRLGLIDELPGWSHNRLKRLTRRPKRHLVDPALAAADHHDTTSTLARRRDRAGQLFESAVVCHIRAAADVLGLGWRFSHLRTAGGDHEVDLIADLPNGDVLAFEAKLSRTVTAADARHLKTLKERLGTSFRTGLVVYPGDTAYRLDDRIAAVPLAALV
ncbi:ATP-binding protein [Candidatus Poriferisodalis sp.]|uniref:ATP-binding protein n=1 Tax=Candidatus Poriferisodalis sp. TaxID=3101277 RepID=UPI003B0286D8